MPTRTPATAVEYAIGLLASRSLPAKKLREKIAARFTGAETDAAMQRMRELRMVDDAAWAERFTRDRFARASRGRHRIRTDLLRAGIDAETAERAIALVVGVDDEREAARRVLDSLLRRLARGTRGDADDRSQGRIFRQMMSRGFPATLVRELLKVS